MDGIRKTAIYSSQTTAETDTASEGEPIETKPCICHHFFPLEYLLICFTGHKCQIETGNLETVAGLTWLKRQIVEFKASKAARQ